MSKPSFAVAGSMMGLFVVVVLAQEAPKVEPPKEDAKPKRKTKLELTKEKNATEAAARRKMALARGDIEFGGRLLTQDRFRRMCTFVELKDFPSLDAGRPILMIGKAMKAGNEWFIATTRSGSGWDRDRVLVDGNFHGTLNDGQLTAVYGVPAMVGSRPAVQAYLVDRPDGNDVGLVFQYRVNGARAGVEGALMRWNVVGQVANTGLRDFKYVEVEARMDAAGDNDRWHNIIFGLPSKSSKPFTIELIGLQLGAVSAPKFKVYIRDFELAD